MALGLYARIHAFNLARDCDKRAMRTTCEQGTAAERRIMFIIGIARDAVANAEAAKTGGNGAPGRTDRR
jgi:hypothetical protein